MVSTALFLAHLFFLS